MENIHIQINEVNGDIEVSGDARPTNGTEHEKKIQAALGMMVNLMIGQFLESLGDVSAGFGDTPEAARADLTQNEAKPVAGC